MENIYRPEQKITVRSVEELKAKLATLPLFTSNPTSLLKKREEGSARIVHKPTLYLRIEPHSRYALEIIKLITGQKIGYIHEEDESKSKSINSVFEALFSGLDVSGNNIGVEGARALAGSTTLTTLDVAANKIGVEGTRALAENTKLTALNISYNNIGVEGARALAGSTTLTTLDVAANNIGDDGARALARSATLTTLDVGGNNIGDDGARALAGNTTLTTLDVAANNI